MTYNTKNSTIVFSFAALLMIMPFVNSNAFGDGSADLDNVCGFTTTNPFAFGDFARGATVSEATVQFPAVADTTGSARFTVSATDWIGDGDRASGTVTVVNVVEDETITINSIVYTAKDSPSLATEFLSGATNDLDSAQSLADKVRANDADVRTSTSGTNVVTVAAETRGTGGNAFTLAESVTDAGTVLSGNTLTGGGSNAIKHMEAEVTKFDITSDGTSSAGTAYASKQAFNAAGVDKEMIGGTDPDNSLDISLEITGVGTLINMPYDGPLTQTLTFTVTCDGT
ncbi:MAG: hypothetical protein ACW9W3_01785 [Candidatus Nitrosopumilus sp. bin_68KS]